MQPLGALINQHLDASKERKIFFPKKVLPCFYRKQISLVRKKERLLCKMIIQILAGYVGHIEIKEPLITSRYY